MVVDKPSGMSVHNAPEVDLCSRISHMLRNNEKWNQRVRLDPRFGVHAVHRLDKETSGVILLACRRKIFNYLSRQFARGEAIKEYLALVHGSLPMTPGEGYWKWPLTPSAAGRRHPQGQGRRKPCQTQYRVLARSRHYSLLRCRLLTGRTHQIRRHAALARHPLLGDRRYGSLRACRYLETHYRFKRLGLHAAGLNVKTPDRDEFERFTSNKLPDAMQKLLTSDQ